MNTLLIANPELGRQTEVQAGLIPETLAAEMYRPNSPETHSGLVVESALGAMALTSGAESDDTYRVKDKRGNYLPEQVADLREVTTERPWALEGPSVHRFLSRDIPTAIVKAYRAVEPETRGKLASKGHTSDGALAALAAGHGWKEGFWQYALSGSMREVLGWNPAQPGPWER